uniref:Major facilitator superfamily (MFS) profile domain-containing protein n=3 Tax=Dendroctonus ponderosae TaxID=77166 RepID=A0AAR5Q1S7_DENPD
IGEITTPKVRGYCGFIPVMATFFGSLLITVLGSYVDIKTTSYICMVPSLLFIGLMSFLPETPHQLIKDGKLEQAKSSLKWLLRKPDIEEDFLSLKADVEQQLADGGTFRNLVTISNNR